MKDFKVFILCPAYLATGGTELLHQLHEKLRDKNVLSFICYTHRSESNNFTPTRFLKYFKDISEVVDEVEDSSSNYLVIPEVFITSIHYEKINLCYWWLSVDNFFVVNGMSLESFLKFNLKMWVKKLINRYPYSILTSIVAKKNFFANFYQSHYAKDFLIDKFEDKKMLQLEDFINREVIHEQNLTKKNIILFYPKKGIEITEELIKLSEHKFDWLPLSNLQPGEMGKLMSEAKVYVDFGNHPGRDRIPREAAANNCIVITNKTGSAKNGIDVPIQEQYKFKDPLGSKEKIFDLIDDIFKNYSSHHRNFQHYRLEISNQENLFDTQVDSMIALLKMDFKLRISK